MPPKMEDKKKEEVPPPPPPPPYTKKQMFSDFIAFCSVVTAYLFISVTLNHDIFESMMGLSLDNPSFIVFLFLSYSAFIFALQVFSAILTFLSNKYNLGKNEIAETINNDTRVSLLTIWTVTVIYVFAHTFIRPFIIEQFCHIAFWLWVAEASRIVGSYLGRMTGINSFSYWGRSVQVILGVGGLLEVLGWGVFAIL